MDFKNYIVLVDEKNKEKGIMEKLEAHKLGLLHRAFSVFIFNNKKELLLQKRALIKYHSPGLWTNTVCSHPMPRETYIDAIKRRLKEEMGFSTETFKKFCFIYKAVFSNGLTEHEYDCVFTGYYNKNPIINKKEVETFTWISKDRLLYDVKKNPFKYTEWFKIILNQSQDVFPS